MRFTLDERKSMRRRLKNRLPAIVNAGLKQVPKFALIVAATFSVSPEIYAQIENGESEAYLVMSNNQDDDFTSYSDEDLAKSMPENPSITLNQRILSEMNALLNQIGKNQGKGDSKKSRSSVMSSEVSKKSYMEHLSAWKEAPASKEADGGKISEFFNVEAQRAGSDMAKTRISFLQSIKSGFKFDFDLGKLFGGGSSQVESPAKGSVRYGLILKDITPVSASDRAAISSDYDELAYAGHADVEWTIGPISEDEGRKLFNFSDVHSTKKGNGKNRSSGSRTASNKSEGNSESFENVNIPSGKFNFGAKPDDVGNLGRTGSLDVFPNVKWQMTQEDGLYQLEYRTKSDGTKIDAHHNFKLPIAGTMKLGRRFDDNWHILSTSAYDILVDKRAPLLSVHYMHMDQRLKGEIKHKLDNNASVSLTGVGKATGMGKKAGKKADESYKAGYTIKF
jgi:hypothetical protein